MATKQKFLYIYIIIILFCGIVFFNSLTYYCNKFDARVELMKLHNNLKNNATPVLGKEVTEKDKFPLKSYF